LCPKNSVGVAFLISKKSKKKQKTIRKGVLIMSGYIGMSRSVNSQRAIENYEIPLSMFSDDIIYDYILFDNGKYSEDEQLKLQNIPSAIWKYVASEKTGPTSWHHTSKCYNKTNHYDLAVVARYLLDNYDTVWDDYEVWLEKKQEVEIKYGYIKVQVWGGSFRRPKFLGHDEAVGIVINDWLYYKEPFKKDAKTYKYKTSANKVVEFETFDSYAALVEKHKKYKGTKPVFNQLIKEKAKNK
jgi:hypothetical protein